MKTGEVAKLLRVDRKTIRNWIDDYGLENIFSPGSRGLEGNIQRDLNEADLLALNTIRVQRAKGVTDWNEIKAHLERGEWETEFPTNATSADRHMIPADQMQQSARVMATVAERDTALAQRDAALAQVAQLEGQVERIKEGDAEKQKRIEELLREIGDVERLREELATERKENDKRIEELVREMGELREKIGRLTGKLEFYQEDKERHETKEKPHDNL
jgi:DNA-binding transcriptional MerR regulator